MKVLSLSAVCTGPFYGQEMSQVLISVRSWVNPRDIVRLEGLSIKKNPSDPIGNWAHHSLACSTVPQPTLPPCTPAPNLQCVYLFSGLKERQSRYSNFGLYNGHKFVFTESEWKVITLARLVWRYGYHTVKLHNYIGSMLDKFEK